MAYFNNLCRLCTADNASNLQVFSEEGKSRGLANKINIHLPIVVTVEDCLPTAICSTCIAALDQCHNLLKQCLNADIQLRQIMGLPDDPDHSFAVEQLQTNLNIGIESDSLNDFEVQSGISSPAVIEHSIVKPKSLNLSVLEIQENIASSPMVENPFEETQPIVSSKEMKNVKNMPVLLKKSKMNFIRKEKTSHKKGKRSIECRVCGKSFESFWYMVRHRSDVHSKEEVATALRQVGLDRELFECEICGKLLSCQSTLNQHTLLHSGVKNFQCDDCDHSFFYKAQLKSHKLVHCESLFPCPECSKQFRNAYALRVHLRTHTGEKPFPCKQCPKAFHSRANYEQHILIHSDVRKFKCTLCPYSAKRAEALRTHLRVHTNERPFTCKICDRAFKQKYDCTKHEKLHEKKPGSEIKVRGLRQSESKQQTVLKEPRNQDDIPVEVVEEDFSAEQNMFITLSNKRKALDLHETVEFEGVSEESFWSV